MSQASSNGRRNRRVLCPNCGVLANWNRAKTEGNFGRIFYKCPYYSVRFTLCLRHLCGVIYSGACFFCVSAREMWVLLVGGLDGTYIKPRRCSTCSCSPVAPVHEPPAPRGERVPVKAVVTATQGQRQGQMVDERILDQLKWIEKLVIACILLVVYAIWTKWN